MENRISVNIDKGIIKLIYSKDIYSDKQYSSNFIDINLSDNFICQNYEAFNDLYNFFVSICPTKEKQDDIIKLVITRLRQFKNV